MKRMTDEELAKEAYAAWHTFRGVELYRGDPDREAKLKDELVIYIPRLVGAVERLLEASVIPAGYFDTSKLLTEVKALREVAQVVADGEVYHDSKGGMLMVASPDALLAKARALVGRE